jgi:SAM-dependent methyltransferase
MSDEDISGMTRRLAGESLAAGNPTGWFEPLYAGAEAAGGAPPWTVAETRPPLREWLDAHGAGDGRSAIVVGCGLGADAEYVAGLGYATTGFDLSPTAIRLAAERGRHYVTYVVADLLDLPAEWGGAFDLVVEALTVQALPRTLRTPATDAVAGLVAPGGTLVVLTNKREDEGDVDGPPWPLSRAEVDAFAATGAVEQVAVEALPEPGQHYAWWRAEFRGVET